MEWILPAPLFKIEEVTKEVVALEVLPHSVTEDDDSVYDDWGNRWTLKGNGKLPYLKPAFDIDPGRTKHIETLQLQSEQRRQFAQPKEWGTSPLGFLRGENEPK